MFVVVTCSYGKVYVYALLCTYSCTRYTCATRAHTSKTNYSISGVKTTLRRALIRACVPTNAVATENPRGCSNTRVSGPSRLYAPVRAPPYTAPPFRSLLLLRFNEMLRPLARDYFPIAPINSPFGRSRLSWRDTGTSFLPDDPWGYGFHRRLLYLVEKYADIVRCLSGELN